MLFRYSLPLLKRPKICLESFCAWVGNGGCFFALSPCIIWNSLLLFQSVAGGEGVWGMAFQRFGIACVCSTIRRRLRRHPFLSLSLSILRSAAAIRLAIFVVAKWRKGRPWNRAPPLRCFVALRLNFFGSPSRSPRTEGPFRVVL